MGSTSIEWTDFSVNPLRARNRATGAIGHFCEKVSPGCAHCYASDWNERVRPQPGGKLIGTGLEFVPANRERVEPFFDDGKLLEVLKRRKPTKWFWCDMTDLFGEWVPDEWIDRCFAIMALTPWHTHQVLTKRADRMRAYLSDPMTPLRIAKHIADRMGRNGAGLMWPLPNVWTGVSVENQPFADARIPDLMLTPSALRWISAEPMVGPLDLHRWLGITWTYSAGPTDHIPPNEKIVGGWWSSLGTMRSDPPRLDWVVPGFESGRRSRPGDVAWIRSVVQQCTTGEVPVFVKQLGAHPYRIGEHNMAKGLPVYLKLVDRKGGAMEEWPADLQVRQFPAVAA